MQGFCFLHRALTLGALLTLVQATVWAQVGVVDMQEVARKYTKAQTMAAQVKIKEDELSKFRQDLMDQLKTADKLSPVEKKNLEDKLNGQFAEKFKQFRDWTVAQETLLKNDFDQAIQSVAKTQSLEMVLPKQTVLYGGKEVTTDVLNALNSAK